MGRRTACFPAVNPLGSGRWCHFAWAALAAFLGVALYGKLQPSAAQQWAGVANPTNQPHSSPVGAQRSFISVRLGPPRPLSSADERIDTASAASASRPAPPAHPEGQSSSLTQTEGPAVLRPLSRYSQPLANDVERSGHYGKNSAPATIVPQQAVVDESSSRGIPTNPVALPTVRESLQPEPAKPRGVPPPTTEPTAVHRGRSPGQIRHAPPWTAEQLTSTVPRLARAALREQLQRHLEKANYLAIHGALFSARSEFESALQIAVETRDEAYRSDTGKKALAQAMTAFEEVDDFARATSITRNRQEVDINNIIVTHRTPVLKEAAGTLTPNEAIQAYLGFAQQQLAMAVGDDPIVADALYGLGRIYYTLALQSNTPEQLNVPKAVVLYRTAVAVNPAHPLAANELAVLLARYGQLHDAKQVLQAVPMEYRSAETWHNLAAIHHRLGEHRWAQEAEAYHEAIRRRQMAAAPQLEREGNIEWLDVSQWVEAGSPGSGPIRHASTQATDSRHTVWR